MFFFGKSDSSIKSALFRCWFALKSASITTSLEASRVAFVAAFDRIYGEKHFSIRCISRSIIFSLFWIFVVLVISHIFGLRYSALGYSRTNFEAIDLPVSFVDAILSNKIVMLLFIQNFVIDFISLMQTRYLLKICRFHSTWTALLILVVDIGLSILIALVPITIEYFLYDSIFHTQRGGLKLEDILHLISGYQGEKQVVFPFIYSTLGSSFILIALCFLCFVIKLLWIFRAPLARLLEWLELQGKPFTIVTSVTSLVLSVILNVSALWVPRTEAASASINDINLTHRLYLEGRPEKARFSLDNRFLLTTSGFRSDAIHLFDLEQGTSNQLQFAPSGAQTAQSRICDNHDLHLRTVNRFCRSGMIDFSPAGRHLIFSDHEYLVRYEIISEKYEEIRENRFVAMAISKRQDNVVVLRGRQSVSFVDWTNGRLLGEVPVHDLDSYAFTEAVATNKGIFIGHKSWNYILFCDELVMSCEYIFVPEDSFPFAVDAQGNSLAIVEHSEESEVPYQSRIVLSVYAVEELLSSGTEASREWVAPIFKEQGNIMRVGFLQEDIVWSSNAFGALHVWRMGHSDMLFRFHRTFLTGGLIHAASSYDGEMMVFSGTLPELLILEIEYSG